MARFSKYFFIIFIVITILPLAFLFFWDSHQIQSLKANREENMMDIGIKQLEVLKNEYINNRELEIKKLINNLSKDEISLQQYKNLLECEQIYFINPDYSLKGSKGELPQSLKNYHFKNIQKTISYYDFVDKTGNKQEIVSIHIIPFKHKKHKGLIVVDKTDFNKLRPEGPFIVKVYFKDKLNANNLLYKLESILDKAHHPEGPRPPQGHEGDRFGPPPPPFNNPDKDLANQPAPPFDGLAAVQHAPHPQKSEDFFPPDLKETNAYKSLTLNNYDNDVTATIVLKCINFSEHHNQPIMLLERQLGLAIIFIGLILSLFAGLYIRKNFISPLIAISDASKRIQSGDLSFFIDIDNHHQEVQSTVQCINNMIGGLKDKEKLRQNFIANLTHDLRTPLLAQERALELISYEFEKMNLMDQLKLAQGIEKNNKHLLRMVNLILESYHFDSETVKVNITDVNLNDIIQQCFEQLSPLASDKGISLINNASGDFPTLKVDSNCLKRILLNLVSNAIENINTGCQITLSGQIVENNAKIIVEDNGVGISEKELPYIFDVYYTGKSDERKIGSGLGLYVCKKLTELIGGSIKAESQKNQFTRFTITLPLN